MGPFNRSDLGSELLILGLAPGCESNKTGHHLLEILLEICFFVLSAYWLCRMDSVRTMVLNLSIVGLPTQFVASLRKTNRSGQKSRPAPPFGGEIAAMKNLKLILALGTIAHNSALNVFGHRKSSFGISHNQLHAFEQGPIFSIVTIVLGTTRIRDA